MLVFNHVLHNLRLSSNPSVPYLHWDNKSSSCSQVHGPLSLYASDRALQLLLNLLLLLKPTHHTNGSVHTQFAFLPDYLHDCMYIIVLSIIFFVSKNMGKYAA
jgi:hypothetical protein